MKKWVFGLVSLGIAVCLFWTFFSSAWMPRTSDRERLQSLLDRVGQDVRRWVDAGNLERPNGCVYAVDVGQLLFFAAKEKDRELYQKLRSLVQAHLLVSDPSDPYTDGFVAWRFKEGDPLDASGTTEALRIAEGLWWGSRIFDEPSDREWVKKIIAGYGRHAGVDQGIWFIRNYFNFQTRAFSVNSFLIDYDPDFLARIRDETNDEKVAELVEKSTDLIRKAVAASGLIYDVVQPEILTLMPGSGQVAFSPNDVIQLSNSAALSERVVKEARDVAEGVMKFAMNQSDPLRLYYEGRSGKEFHSKRSGIESYGPLLRLAKKLENRDAIERFLPPFLAFAEKFARNPSQPRAYTASEILTTIQVLLAPAP